MHNIFLYILYLAYSYSYVCILFICMYTYRICHTRVKMTAVTARNASRFSSLSLRIWGISTVRDTVTLTTLSSLNASSISCVCVHTWDQKKKIVIRSRWQSYLLLVRTAGSVCVSTNKAPQHKKKKSWYGHIDNVKVFSASSVSCVCVKIYI